MSGALDFDEDEPIPVEPAGVRRTSARIPPQSVEAEECLLNCAFIDSADVLPKCIEAGISADSFSLNTHALVFREMLALHSKGVAAEVYVVAEQLQKHKQLEAVGGYAFLTQITSRTGTTAQVSYFVERVRSLEILRNVIVAAKGAVEEAHGYAGDIEELVSSIKARFDKMGQRAPVSAARKPSSFIVPPDGDRSILLGDGFLNRGDGGIIVAGSGMGKSAMVVQKAFHYALGRDFHGIKPNGCLKSIIVQAEDSDGDIAEEIASMVHAMKLKAEDIATIDERVVFITERVRRGAKFIAELRRLVKLHKPDLVFLNPLVAFMDGDLTTAKDVGTFLREGLNSLNEPPTFAYVIAHHTTKPPNDKNKVERTWNEVMYDMGGSYDIPGWARFVISLRATETDGEFNLVLAKRGSRAGVTKKVPQGAGFREEIVKSIPLKHSHGSFKVPGRTKPVGLIYWEAREEGAPAPEGAAEKAPDSAAFVKLYREILPLDPKKAIGLQEFARQSVPIKKMNSNQAADALIAAVAAGLLGNAGPVGEPRYYVKI